jgi:hypothetical protein
MPRPGKLVDHSPSDDGRLGVWTRRELERMDSEFCRAVAASLGRPLPPTPHLSPYEQLLRALDNFRDRERRRRARRAA